MLRSWRVKLKLLLATVTLAVLLSWLYLFVGSLECEWVLLGSRDGPPQRVGKGRPRPWSGCSAAAQVAAGVSERCVSRGIPGDRSSGAVTLAGHAWGAPGPLDCASAPPATWVAAGRALPRCARGIPHVSPADGRFLLLPPCLGEQPSRDVEREALASRVRRVEEENQQLRLQLSQAQAEGSDGNPQWGTSAEDGEPPGGERSNRTACPKQRTVHKCEVGDGTGAVGKGCRMGGRDPG